MVRRYLHSGVIKYKTEGAYDEATGKYSDGDTIQIDLPKCRFDFKGKQMIHNASGDIEDYNYIIYAPLFDEEVRDYGTITWNEENRSLNIKHAEKYQRHVKIWANT